MGRSKLKFTRSIMAGMSFLFGFCWSHDKIYILLLVVKQLTSSALPLLLIFIPKYILDLLTEAMSPDTALTYILILCCIYLVVRLFDNYCDANIFVRKLGIFNDFQIQLSRQLAFADYGQIESSSFLDIKEKAFKFLYGEAGFASALEQMFSLIDNVILFVSIIVIVSQLNILLIAGFIAVALLNAYFSSKTRKRANQFDIEKAPLERKNMYYGSLFSEYRYGKEIRVNNLVEWLSGKYTLVLQDVLKSYKKIVRTRAKAEYTNSFFSTLQTMLILAALAFQYAAKAITAGDFMMYWSSANSFNSAMFMATGSITSIFRYNDYYEAVKKYLNMPSSMRAGKKPLDDIETIEFKNVWFRYPEQKEYALKNISIKINAREKWSIVGENGSGKSTFIKLLARLYDVEQGEILVNGVNIKEYDYEKYVSRFSVVFQDSQLFSMSVYENITFSGPLKENGPRFEDAVEKAGIKGKIAGLSNAEDTIIHRDFDDNGYEPSGGEVQKIALARAIYKDGSLFILDEPTASMDPRAEYELYSHFNYVTKDRTVIFISHRLSSTRFCDKVALFSGGSILEIGTHKELMESNHYYKELYMMQAQYYRD